MGLIYYIEHDTAPLPLGPEMQALAGTDNAPEPDDADAE